MIKIIEWRRTDITILDARLKQGIGVHYNSMYGGVDHTIASLTDDATAQEQTDVTTALAEVDTLTVVADKTTVTVSEPGDLAPDEAVITCAALPTDFDYVVYLNSVLSISGTVSDGTLELSLVEAGDYTVELRNQANYETGKIIITGV